MSTLTHYPQLREYWWNAHEKRNNVRLQVRDLRPRQSLFLEEEILARLALAKAKLENRPILTATQTKPSAAERYLSGEPVSQEELPIFLRHQAG